MSEGEGSRELNVKGHWTRRPLAPSRNREEARVAEMDGAREEGVGS